MKNFVRIPLLILALLRMPDSSVSAQTNMAVTSSEVEAILKGSYASGGYQASSIIMDPGLVSTGLVNGISPDTLKASLFALKSFQNRNTFSDTLSATRGIGAARRWVYRQFLNYSNANEKRLRVAYLEFDYSGCTATSSITRHRNIIAVLPGTQTGNSPLVIIEGHLDSRNVNNCDITGNAPGIGDNATGTALVMELARVLSKYTFRSTIVFSVNTGEEQGTIGAKAFADYLKNNHIPVKAVNNNDVSGGIFCGHTASGPGCPGYGNIDSTDLRIFSLGSFNSPHKQWARYIKLEYKEQVSTLVQVLTDINIMTPEDRAGRGGDHQPFRADGYTAVRLTQANEDGDASNGQGYIDRQHSDRDSLGMDRNHDGMEDTLYVDVNYLARNALVNGIGVAMVALGPDTITLAPAVISANKVKVSVSPAGASAYRVAIRSATNDWDSVYTITGVNPDTIQVPYGSNTNFYISAAAIDQDGIESQFSTEYALTTRQIILELGPGNPAPLSPPPAPYGIQLLPNRPNPFDEATMITIVSGTDLFSERTWILISSPDGRVLQKRKVPLKKGINEVLYEHGYGIAGIYICSLVIDGLPVQSRKMIFRNR